jgi:RNA polymerase sigma factor (sigma-70 family)
MEGYEHIREDLTGLRQQWIADHILPWEAEVRGWLGRYSRRLRAEDVDDLIQESYAKLWSTDFTRIRDGRAFLYTVVRNTLQDQLRRARVVPMEYVAEMDALEVDEAPGPERWMHAHQQYQLLLRVLQELTPHRRAVFQLRKFEGLSVREIAQRQGIAEKTAENLLGLALAQVTKALFAEGVAPVRPTGEREYERRRNSNKSKPSRS